MTKQFSVWHFIRGRVIIRVDGFTSMDSAEAFVSDLEPRATRCPYTNNMCYLHDGDHVYATQKGVL